MKHSYLLYSLLAACLTVMPFKALAYVDGEPIDPPTDTQQDEPTPKRDALYIDGTDIIAHPEAIELLSCIKEGSIHYDTESKTLTLTDATFKATSEYLIDSRVNGLAIHIEGANTIESGFIRLCDTSIKGGVGSSLIATTNCYILARDHNLSFSNTYLSLVAGGQVGIDNRGGKLTLDDVDVIILNGAPALYSDEVTCTDCKPTSSVPGTISFDTELGTYKIRNSAMNNLTFVASHHHTPITLTLSQQQSTYYAYKGREHDFGMPMVIVPSDYNGTLSYASSNPEAISITNDGKVSFHALGESIITVTAPASENYLKGLLTFRIAYTKRQPQMYYTRTDLTVPFTHDYPDFPKLIYTGDGRLTYSTSNPDVLDFDKENGIHLMGVGQATITVTATETELFQAASASFTCTVTEAPEQQPSDIYWTNFNGNELNVEVGQERQYYSGYPVAAAAKGYDAQIYYTSSKPSCVSVDYYYGTLTFMAPGTVTITATAPATDYFTESSISYVVHYFEPAPDPVQIAMSFPASDYTVHEGQEADFVQPMLSITPAAYDGIITYASSNPDCIRVDAHTGQLTFVALGTATITATASTTDLYIGDGVSASYTLSYEEAPDLRPVPQLAFTTSEADVAFMPDGTVKVPLLMLQYNGTEPLTFSSSDQQVVSTDADGTLYITGREGTATITVTSAESDQWKAAESALLIRVADQTAVGVKGMANSGRKQDSYDLSGRKQTRNTPRGIFITAGRKVATR